MTARREFTAEQVLEAFTIQDKTIQVVYDKTYLYELGLEVAGATATEQEDLYLIIVDDIFKKYISPESQVFFLLHELSHILNGDVELNRNDTTSELISNRMELIEVGKVQPSELLADEGAFNLCEDKNLPVKALTELKDFYASAPTKWEQVTEELVTCSINELNLRIKHIESLNV